MSFEDYTKYEDEREVAGERREESGMEGREDEIDDLTSKRTVQRSDAKKVRWLSFHLIGKSSSPFHIQHSHSLIISFY